MAGGEGTDELAAGGHGRLAQLRASAKGWHGIQLAVLGFIGLCGVLQQDQASIPHWLQELAGILVLAALALACVAVYLVGCAAWPLYGARPQVPQARDAAQIARTAGQLTAGVRLTFICVGVLALATAVSWWPTQKGSGGGLVEAQGATGESWCGRLAQTRAGTLRLATADGPVVVPLDGLTAVGPIDRCR